MNISIAIHDPTPDDVEISWFMHDDHQRVCVKLGDVHVYSDHTTGDDLYKAFLQAILLINKGPK